MAIVGLLFKSLSTRKCLDYRFFFVLSLTVAPLGVDCVLLLASSSGCRRAKALQMIGTIKVPKEDTSFFLLLPFSFGDEQKIGVRHPFWPRPFELENRCDTASVRVRSTFLSPALKLATSLSTAESAIFSPQKKLTN